MTITDKTLTIQDLQIGKLYHVKMNHESDKHNIIIFIVRNFKVKNPNGSSLCVTYMLQSGKICFRYERDFKSYTTKELK